MATKLTYRMFSFDGNNYIELIQPIGWALADLEGYATSYAQTNNIVVTIYKALEDWNTDGTSTSYAQS